MNIFKKLFLSIIVVLNSFVFALDEPRIDLILSTPKVYHYISDGSNMTLTASNGGNGVLKAKLEESYYDNELNTTMNAVFNYNMSWNGRGYEGGDSKSNWVMVDTYYQGVRVIGTMNKLKRYIVLDLENKTIKFKSYGLFKIEVVGHGTSYFRMINDNESEISSSSYNNYLSSFNSNYNSISLASDTATPTNIKNQIFDDLQLSYLSIQNGVVYNIKEDNVPNQFYSLILSDDSNVVFAGSGYQTIFKIYNEDLSTSSKCGGTFSTTRSSNCFMNSGSYIISVDYSDYDDGNGIFSITHSPQSIPYVVNKEIQNSLVYNIKEDNVPNQFYSLTLSEDSNVVFTGSGYQTIFTIYNEDLSKSSKCGGTFSTSSSLNCFMDNGNYVIQVYYSDYDDGNGVFSINSQSIIPYPFNSFPIANAGSDQIIDYKSDIFFDASASSDIDGSIVSYQWKEGEKILSNQISFTKSNFSIGTHTIILTVTDNKGLKDEDEITINVQIVDNDNDGISDEYENNNGLNSLVDDSLLDLDNDGKTNLEEYKSGTKANDPNSRIFTLNLNTGWNLVSLELNSSVDLNTVNNSNIVVVRSLKDDKWNTWTKENLNNPDQYFNTIEDGYGYWIKATQDTSLDIKGDRLPDNKTITPNRWNMIGSRKISDIDQFFTDNPRVRMIWKYEDGKYHVISSDNDLDTDLSPLENSGDVIKMDRIEKNEGFFVK